MNDLVISNAKSRLNPTGEKQVKFMFNVDNVNGAKYRPTARLLLKVTRLFFEHGYTHYNYEKNRLLVYSKTYNFMAAKIRPIFQTLHDMIVQVRVVVFR